MVFFAILMAQRWPAAPGQILDRRYARGEITQEQHEQMRRYIDREN